jgi:hypothetical protein
VILEFIEYIKNSRGELNARAVEKGYNPFIPGDPFHESIENYKLAMKKIKQETKYE